ncbi:hypothetical protein Z945_3774 [Sulfitobacter noctilucae]|uniref:hypothetical protein n=1 Tax=Sulfitobacter noctilucae TaxID=1342302 RepID=UPI00046A9DC5|nr:hypothetical protein [Sulfitobacter noctilucae]KIN69882.1 hypothetical protein Z945_3774 [Sulfitobacter noctilucae]
MAFENDTNTGRVAKMVESFALIQKSAKSNREDADSLGVMMRPLIAALTKAGVMGAPVDAPKGQDAPTLALTAGQRAALHLADRASLARPHRRPVGTA